MRCWALGVASAAFLALALLSWCAANFGPGIIRNKVNEAVKEQVIWRPDSPPSVYRRFERDDHPGDPVNLRKFYLFNVTNVKDVRWGAKPLLDEVGPYVYSKHRARLDPVFSADGRVRFREYEYYVPTAPGAVQGARCAECDLITTLNIPLAGALESILARAPAQAAPWLAVLAALLESGADASASGLFATRSASQLLWGYDDPLLVLASRFVPGLSPRAELVHNMSSEAEAAAGGASVMQTGAADAARVGDYEVWRGVARVTSWAAPHVEGVRGGDGRQFPPGMQLGAQPRVWVGELFRSATLRAEQQVAVRALPALRLTPDPSLAAPDPRYFQTLLGLMNISSPHAAGPSGRPGRPGPPLFLSLPHFCGADASLAAGVEGLQCNLEAHSLFLDVEPTTGISVRAAKRLMLSSWFGQRWRVLDPGVRESTFLPVFWAEEVSQASDAQLDSFAPLARAKAVQAWLERYARPAAAGSALLSLLCLLSLLVAGRPLHDAAQQAAGYAGLADAEAPPNVEEPDLGPPSPPSDDAPTHDQA